MIRKSTINLNDANPGKLKVLDSVMDEALRVVNLYAEALWKDKNFSCKFVDFKVDTWLSARMQQCLGKQASEMVKSQRKKRNKTLPVLRRKSITLDLRFVTFGAPSEGFDFWTTLTSIGNKIKLILPGKKHKHFNSLVADGWTLKEGARLRKNEKGFWLDVYFQKEVAPRKDGITVGVDTGWKKLAVTSHGQMLGKDIAKLCHAISRKKRNSKGFKRALETRDAYIRQVVKQVNLEQVKDIVVEDLRQVRKNARKEKKLSHKFMSKFQFWTYAKFLDWLEARCEVVGVQCHRVNPAYTSRTCPRCGTVDKHSRKGEKFCCTGCGFTADADENASQNVLSRFLVTGAYGPG